MKRTLSLSAVALLALASACALGGSVSEPTPDLPESALEVQAATGTHRFQVWVAADDASRTRGLMYVRSLPPDRGMLFLFEPPQPVAFWMKDTYLSLDLVFIGPDARVVNVAADARPLSLAPIESAGPVQAVLEFAAGTARRIGLMPGDRVRHPSLRTTSTRPRPAPPTPGARSRN